MDIQLPSLPIPTLSFGPVPMDLPRIDPTQAQPARDIPSNLPKVGDSSSAKAGSRKPLQKRELHKEDCHGKEGHDEGQAGRDAEHRVGSSFPEADQLYTEAQVQAIFEDVDQHSAIARAFEPNLPDFPDLPINYYNLENLRNCYVWAYGIVAIYGDAASLAIQGNLEKAIQRKDAAAQRGWSNVQFGLMDMWRTRFPGETIH